MDIGNEHTKEIAAKAFACSWALIGRVAMNVILPSNFILRIIIPVNATIKIDENAQFCMNLEGVRPSFNAKISDKTTTNTRTFIAFSRILLRYMPNRVRQCGWGYFLTDSMF